MPRLPVYERSVVPQYTSGVAPRSGEAQAAIGAGIAQLGQTARNVTVQRGQLVQQRQRELEELEDRDFVASQSVDISTSYQTRFIDESAKAPAGAKGFTETFIKGYEADLEERLATAPSDRARAELKLRAQEIRGQLFNKSLVFERDSGTALRVNNIGESVNKLSNAVQTNPGSFSAFKAQLDDTLNLYEGELPADQLAELRTKSTQQLAKSALVGQVEVDPDGALATLQGGQFDDLLDADAKSVLVNRAQGEIKAREAAARAEERAARVEANAIKAQQRAEASEARREAREIAAQERVARAEAQASAKLAFQDEKAAALAGKAAIPGIDATIVKTFDGPDADRMLTELQLAREEGFIGSQLSSLPPDQLNAALAGRQPEGVNFADEAASAERLTSAAQAVLKRRQEDPALEASKAFPEIAKLVMSANPREQALGIRQNLDTQKNIFGLRDDQLKPLPGPAADGIVERFKAAKTTDEKLGLITAVSSLPGEDGTPDFGSSQLVLQQLEAAGLPPGVELALERQLQGDPGGAREIINALTVDPKTLPVNVDYKPEDVKLAVNSLDEGGLAVDALTVTLTGQEGDATAFGRRRDTVQRLTEIYTAGGMEPTAAATKANTMVSGDGPVIAEPTLAAVRLPKGADADAVYDGFETIRESLDLSYLAPTRERVAQQLLSAGGPVPEVAQVEAVYQGALRDFDRWAATVQDTAVFINDGDGFTIINQVPGPFGLSGRPIPGPDGNAIRVTLDQALSGQLAPPATPAIEGGAGEVTQPSGGAGPDQLRPTTRSARGTPQVAPIVAELDRVRREVAKSRAPRRTQVVRGDDGLIAGADELDEDGNVVRRRRVRRGQGGRIEGIDDG